MFEDKELWSLFSAESEEHLQSLEEGLLRLESMPSDAPTLAQVFRSAHSLKGAARMLGASRVEVLSHAFEDALSGAARGGGQLSPGIIERLYGALDAMRALVREAVEGQPSGVNLEQVLHNLTHGPVETSLAPPRLETYHEAPLPPASYAPLIPPRTVVSAPPYSPRIPEPEAPTPSQIIPPQATPPQITPPQTNPPGAVSPHGVSSEPMKATPPASESVEAKELLEPPILVAFHSNERTSATPATPHPVPQEVTAPLANPEIPVINAEALVQTPSPEWKIETMRVEPAKLDALLSMAGELVVSTTRAGRSRVELDALISLWEEGSRASSAQRRLIREMDGLLPESSKGTLREMERLIEREALRWETLGTLLSRLRGSADDVNRLASVVGEMEEAIRGVRLLPLSTLFALFPRTVRDLAKAQGKDVQFTLEGGDTVADKRIIEELKDPLMHMVRNAVDHGIEVPEQRVARGKTAKAELRLRGYQTSTQVVVELADNGRGLDLEAIKRSALKKRLITEEELPSLSQHAIQELIFAPGFSTASMITEVSGRGVGLDVVRANVERLRGTITVESLQGQGTLFRLTLPVTLATTRVLLVRLGEQTFAIPVEAVVSVHHVNQNAFFTLQGRSAFAPGNDPIFLEQLRDLLELPAPKAQNGHPSEDRGTACIVITAGNDLLAVCVDAVVDEQEIILKPIGAFLKRVRNVSGATILDTGEVCLVLNPPDIIKSATRRSAPSAPLATKALVAGPERAKVVLLVEDSITTRTQEKRILEGAGYEVVIAVDGLDGWAKLNSGEFDAIVSDIEMPRMDGLSLAAKIRSNPKYEELPIILVSTLASDSDRRRGVEAGANAYITKGSFDQKALLDALRKLV